MRNNYVTVKMQKGQLLKMLMDRIAYWTEDEKEINLFKKMYKNFILNDAFENVNLDIKTIADKDYINNCIIIEEGEYEFDETFKLYKQGATDIYCDNEDEPKMFLVRCC